AARRGLCRDCGQGPALRKLPEGLAELVLRRELRSAVAAGRQVLEDRRPCRLFHLERYPEDLLFRRNSGHLRPIAEVSRGTAPAGARLLRLPHAHRRLSPPRSARMT